MYAPEVPWWLYVLVAGYHLTLWGAAPLALVAGGLWIRRRLA